MALDTTHDNAPHDATDADLDMQRVGEFAEQVARTVTGAATTAMMLVGDRLGLYGAMARSGAVTPAGLSRATGTHERYVREWLAQQAAAGVVTYDAADETFTLPPEHAAVLAGDESPASMAGVAPLLLGMYRGADRIVDAFRTGHGVGWGEQDPAIFESTERFFRVGYRNNLASEWIPRLHGIAARLAAGGRAADIGCGYGAALILLAEAFPTASFVGYDPHGPSVETARQRASTAGVGDRVRFEVADATSYPPDGYDLVCYFATLHDLGDPVGAASYARTALGAGRVADARRTERRRRPRHQPGHQPRRRPQLRRVDVPVHPELARPACRPRPRRPSRRATAAGRAPRSRLQDHPPCRRRPDEHGHRSTTVTGRTFGPHHYETGANNPRTSAQVRRRHRRRPCAGATRVLRGPDSNWTPRENSVADVNAAISLALTRSCERVNGFDAVTSGDHRPILCPGATPDRWGELPIVSLTTADVPSAREVVSARRRRSILRGDDRAAD